MSAAVALVLVGLVGWALVPAGSSPNSAENFSVSAGNPAGANGIAANGTSSSSSAHVGGPGAPVQSVNSSGGTGGSSSSSAGPNQSSAIAGGGPANPSNPGVNSTPGQSQTATPASCGGSSASTQAIKLGLPLLDIAGPAVNSAFNIPSSAEQQGDWSAILDALNAAGGVNCHPLTADFQSVNPADNTSGQTDCIQYAQDKVFAVLGYLSANATPGTGGDLCVVQHGIPDFHPQAVPADEVQQYYPYMFGMERTDILFRNFAEGAAQVGQFSKSAGFSKLGVVYSDCQPSLEKNFLVDLAAVGVSGGRLDTFDLGCPSGYASPSTLAQAVLQFKNDHVSTVSFEEPGDPDLPDFTRVASSQFFTPHYLMPDDGLLLDTDHNSNGPNPSNFDGAVAITPNQYGALDTSPRPPLSPSTAACDKALTAKGLPDTEHSDGGVAGIDCDLAWLFVAAASHAPRLAQNELAAGLEAAGSVPFAYPGGPNVFNANDSTTGGEFWRTVQFHGSCQCWEVTRAAFASSF